MILTKLKKLCFRGIAFFYRIAILLKEAYTVKFKFNGESIVLDRDMTIKEYISLLNIDTTGIIVLVDDEILPKEQLDILIKDSCNIEVLKFVCGG
nr:sulfur carrier protein ThiS [Cetobacterium sp. 8H]